MIFRATTPLNSSPLHSRAAGPYERHLSQTGFSLSPKSAGAGNSTYIYGPKSEGQLEFQRTYQLQDLITDAKTDFKNSRAKLLHLNAKFLPRDFIIRVGANKIKGNNLKIIPAPRLAFLL